MWMNKKANTHYWNSSLRKVLVWSLELVQISIIVFCCRPVASGLSCCCFCCRPVASGLSCCCFCCRPVFLHYYSALRGHKYVGRKNSNFKQSSIIMIYMADLLWKRSIFVRSKMKELNLKYLCYIGL